MNTPGKNDARFDPVAALDEMRGNKKPPWVLFLATSLIVASAIGAWLYREDIGRAWESAPPAYDEAMSEPMDAWMREALPQFVIDVDHGRLEEGGKKFVEASKFLPAFERRAKGLIETIASFNAYTQRRGMLVKASDLRPYLNDITREFQWLEADLHATGAPYSIDHNLHARPDGREWSLTFFLRASKVHGVSTFAADGRKLNVMRVSRIDNLAVTDLLHGASGNGVAKVYVEEVQRSVINRYLPALSEGATLRDIFSDRPETDPWAESFRAVHARTVPESMRNPLRQTANVARRRRRVLERVQVVLESRGARLREPSDFLLSNKTYESIAITLHGMGHGDLAMALKGYSEGGHMTPDQRELIKSGVGFVFEQMVRVVERHEAWHLLNPEPHRKSDAPWPPVADNEGLAYLGMLADADEEILFAYDKLARLSRLDPADDERFGNTATGLVVRNLWKEFHGRDDEEQRGTETVSATLKRRKELARKRMHDWYGEARSVEWQGYQAN